jgi:hypothetical protein
VGIGVAETVVFTAAVETGPTKRFQRSSTWRVRAVVKAAGFATVLPLSAVAVVGVGMMVVGRGELEFWQAANPASIDNESSEGFMMPLGFLVDYEAQ